MGQDYIQSTFKFSILLKGTEILVSVTDLYDVPQTFSQMTEFEHKDFPDTHQVSASSINDHNRIMGSVHEL